MILRGVTATLTALLMCTMLVVAPRGGHAQSEFPTDTVRIVIPTTAGGGADIMARRIAEELTEMWDQPVVVDNKPGGGVLVGTQIVADAEPDGYTLLFTYVDHIYYPSMRETMPYDAIEDFTGITTVATIPQIVAINADFGVDNVEQLIDKLKEDPGRYNFASAGVGSSLHLTGELFKSTAGVDMVHVPYKGTSPGVVDLISGQVQVMFPTMLSIRQYVESGEVKALAVTSAERSDAAPGLPTVAESGLPDYSASIWYQVLAPSGTPPEIVDKLNEDFIEAINRPAVTDVLENRGAKIETSTPDELNAQLRSEFEKWNKIIEDAGIKIQ